MKTEIRFVQDFYAQEMQAHGYGNITFRVETDPQGEPMVHRVDGNHPNSYYIGSYTEVSNAMLNQIEQQFNLSANIYIVLLDNGSPNIGDREGVGGRYEKNGGYATVASEFEWKTLAHELGHAFGLNHDFNNDTYIMSYGNLRNRLSTCSVEYLSVQPYFNSNVQPEDTVPTIERISPRIYPAGAKNVPIKLKVSDSEGLHQVILSVKTRTSPLSLAAVAYAAGFLEVKACQGLGGVTDTVVEFDYDGIIPSEDLVSFSYPTTQHPITIEAIDVNGNVSSYSFNLESDSPENYTLGEYYLYLDIDLEGRSLTSAFAERPYLVRLPGLGLRQENITSVVEIVPVLSGMPNLKRLDLEWNLISDISPIASLTNLTYLDLSGNDISDISPLLSLPNLTRLGLSKNPISDLSVLGGLTHLTELNLLSNNISDLSPLVASKGLKNGDTVNVWSNPLSYASIHTHIPVLQSRGVEVNFNDRARPALVKISGDNQTGAAAALTNPFVVEVQHSDGTGLAGISVTFTVTAGEGTLSVTSTTTDANGRAASTLTLGPHLGTNTVSASVNEFIWFPADPDGSQTGYGVEWRVILNAIADTKSPQIAADVNDDGVVNILDLVAVAASLESEPSNLTADVNGDGVVNILDVVLVAGLLESTASAPAARPKIPETLTTVEVQGWLTAAISLEVTDVTVRRGIMVLGQLLAALTPATTELLPNYPNPFNPETWIPYRLAEDGFVTLTIYDLSGQVVRTLEVGHQIASAYETRSKAIYWDGRNEVGERVASGVYYYHLSTGDYSATRKMLILK